MFETILIVLGAIIAVLVVFAVIVARQPGDFRVVRSATISASPSAVFAQVNDFHNWQAWSPWAKRDPAMKQTYEGAPAGTGAIYTWAGNSDVGAGRMTITRSDPSKLITIKLEFLKPFVATNTAEFAFVPQGNQTYVTWSMSGTKVFIMKAFGLFMNMDKAVGGDFEKGLASLKSIAEAAV